jgi:tetratricopeptide (TPR) repeat protein
VQWANAVIKNALKTKDTIQLAEGWYLYGKIYEASGDLLTAKRYFMRSLRIIEPRGDSEELSRLYVRLADLGFTFYNYADNLRYARLALAVAQRIRSDKALLRAYSLMRQIHEADWSQMPGQTNRNLPKPNYDSILYYLKKIEPLARRSPDPIELAVVNRYLGAELLRRNDPKAIAYYEEVLKIYVRQKKPADQVNAMLGLASVYVHFGQPQRAKEFLMRAEQLWQILPSSNSRGTRFGFEGTYTYYYQAIGDWKRAFEHQQKAFDLERNRFLADREGAVSRLSVEYETEKKEAQLKSQQKELALSTENLKNQRRFLATALVLLVGGDSSECGVLSALSPKPTHQPSQ